MLENLEFHHIGIAVSDFKKIIAYYKLLGYKEFNKAVVRDELQMVDLMLLTHDVHPDIELVKPFSNQSPVKNYLKNNDTSIYHFCYEVDSFAETFDNLKKEFRVFNVSKPKPAILFDNRLVTFYYIHEVGLIELLCNPPKN
jgi:methylmalonyl-CoA/ethylmalonyl-CoA epimerase